MNFTTLVAGPAQAGSQSPVTTPGIGQPAGAGSAPTAGEAGLGFASLVALALGQLEGSAAGDGPSSGPTRHGAAATGLDDPESIVDAPASEDESLLEAPVDAATLSVLIALATPTAAPVAMPAQEIAEPGSVDLAVSGGAPAGTSVTAPLDLISRPAIAPADGAGVSSTSATTTANVPTAAATDPVSADAPDAPAAANTAVASALAESAPAAPAPAAADHAAAVSAAVPAVPPTAPAPEAHSAPGAASALGAATAAAASRGVVRPAGHPLRETLAAMAGQSSTADSAASTASTGQAVVPAAPSVPVAGDVDRSQDARPTAPSRLDVGATAAAPSAASSSANPIASDTSGTGERASDGSRDGSAPSAFFRPTDLRFDVPVAASQMASPVVPAPDAVPTASALPALPGLSPVGDGRVAAIDVPSAARFEQAMQSLDPDVRNLQAMVRTVRLFTAGSGASEARLVLEPEHLGPVALTVRVEQGSVSAHFRADTPAAHRWIETHQQELRTGLREQGLEVKELVVTTDPDGRRERRQDAQPAKPARPRRAQTAGTPRFEVLV